MYPTKGVLAEKEVMEKSAYPSKHDPALEGGKERAMYPTKNNLPENVRIQAATLLQGCLVDSIDLTLQAKQAHWNVKGPSFIALHELFDKVAEDAETYVDLIAERIVQLGGIAVGTLGPVDKRSNLPAYPVTISSGKEHVAALSHALAYYGEFIRKSIAEANQIEDADTADILTQVSRAADKYLWFVEAHGQAPN
jgi:starvation-inducible DNA-binding protein